jgi:hypothetical protein
MPEPSRELLEAAVSAVPAWVARSVERVLRSQGIVPGPDVQAATLDAAGQAQRSIASELGALLDRDVDEQRENPLAVLRRAVRYPTAVLREAGATPVRRDEVQERLLPDDVYDLSPATWRDVDPALHEPGITWGAWKAMTVLERRRAEGLR